MFSELFFVMFHSCNMYMCPVFYYNINVFYSILYPRLFNIKKKRNKLSYLSDDVKFFGTNYFTMNLFMQDPYIYVIQIFVAKPSG